MDQRGNWQSYSKSCNLHLHFSESPYIDFRWISDCKTEISVCFNDFARRSLSPKGKAIQLLKKFFSIDCHLQS